MAYKFLLSSGISSHYLPSRWRHSQILSMKEVRNVHYCYNLFSWSCLHLLRVIFVLQMVHLAAVVGDGVVEEGQGVEVCLDGFCLHAFAICTISLDIFGCIYLLPEISKWLCAKCSFTFCCICLPFVSVYLFNVLWCLTVMIWPC